MTGLTPNSCKVAQLNLRLPWHQLDLICRVLMTNTAFILDNNLPTCVILLFYTVNCFTFTILLFFCHFRSLLLCLVNFMSAPVRIFPREHTVIKGISSFLKDTLTGTDSGCHQGSNLWPTLLFMCLSIYIGGFLYTLHISRFTPSFHLR